MAIESKGLHHLTLRVTDLGRAKQFYAETLGFPCVVEIEGLVLVNVQGVMLGLRGPATQSNPKDRFDPFRVGLDHVALSVGGANELDGLKQQLESAGVANNGIERDELTQADYISFYDPDGIAWELYAMPS